MNSAGIVLAGAAISGGAFSLKVRNLRMNLIPQLVFKLLAFLIRGGIGFLNIAWRLRGRASRKFNRNSYGALSAALDRATRLAFSLHPRKLVRFGNF